MLTKPPSHQTVATLLKILNNDEKILLFACGDGVYSIIEVNPLSNIIHNILKKGGIIYASREDMDARGVTFNLVIEGVRIPRDFYGMLIHTIMKEENILVTI
ncbi:MAG: DsrH/TusB family sulfur metabolism protein [Candidatus Bathyarchaeota archaeon]